MSEDNPQNNLQAPPNKYYFTAQARRAHVRQYQSNSETMIAYCEKNHLALSTFKAWVSKYGEKKAAAAFIPITVPIKNETNEFKKLPTSQRLEIITGAIKIVLPEINDIAVVIKLIKELSNANTVKSTGDLVL